MQPDPLRGNLSSFTDLGDLGKDAYSLAHGRYLGAHFVNLLTLAVTL